jgi:hypothetical protein
MFCRRIEKAEIKSMKNSEMSIISSLKRRRVCKIDQLRINNKGRETPVADARTCVEIIWCLPGKAAKEFRRACAHYITRILTGDSSVIVDVQNQLDEINGTKSMMTHTIVDNSVCDKKLHESHLKLASVHQESKPCMQSTQKSPLETKYLEHADVLWERVTDYCIFLLQVRVLCSDARNKLGKDWL